MKKKRFFIIAAFFIFLFLVEDWAVYRPGVSRLERLNRQVAEARSQFLGTQIPPQKLARIKEIIVQNTIHGLTEKDGEDHASEALGRLMATLKELEIELLSITPKQAVPSGSILSSPYVMELRCDYRRFALLLEAIERSNDLMEIDHFELVAVKEEVVATLTIDIQMFIEDEES
jgi:hypothetical protein